MADKQNDWKHLGQLMSKMQLLYTTARDTFAGMSIGVEIIPWLVGDGAQAFTEALTSLGEKYRATERVRIVSKSCIEVNLDAPPKLPFYGAHVAENAAGGWVTLERKKAGLYINGEKIILHLGEGQKNGKSMKGHALKEALNGKLVLHPNILDALMEHAHLIPVEWKQDAKGRTVYIFFWGVVFRGSVGFLYVRYVVWFVDAWHSVYRWLGRGWGGQDPAALRAS